jgi:SAM-dependent methyltransferase
VSSDVNTDMDLTPANRIELTGEARARVDSWSAGAQALALLSSVHKLGLTRFLIQPRPYAELAEFTRLSPDHLRCVIDVLDRLSVVEQTGDVIRLRPPFAEMMSQDGLAALGDALDQAQLLAQLVGEAVGADELPALSDSEALTLARGVTFQPARMGQHVFSETLDSVPEYSNAVREGRLLDVGCGVASGLLTTAALFPRVRGVGIELNPLVAAEAGRRVKARGMSDRITIRTMYAPDLDEPAAYNACFWAQPFFTEEDRLPTLKAIHRALLPGGVLLEQELDSEPVDAADKPAFDMRAMVFRSWGMPFARPAEHLAAEAEAAGFTLVRIATTNLGRMVVLRRLT